MSSGRPEWAAELLSSLAKREVIHESAVDTASTELVWKLAGREYRACQENFPYFYFNYWPINHPPGSPTPGWNIPSKNRAYQIQEAEVFQRTHDNGMLPEDLREDSVHQVRLKARQIGFTTLAMAMTAWCGLFHPGHNWLVLSQDEDAAKDTIATKLKDSLARVAPWILHWSAEKIDNRSSGATFEAYVDGKKWRTTVEALSTTGNTGRSRSVFGLVADEAARNENYGSAFTAVEPAVYGPMFVFSTANGMGNWFHEVWLDSEKPDSVWENGFWPWDAVPERSERWYETKKASMRDRLHEFYQEYPATPQEAFSKSGQVAFDDELVDAQPIEDPIAWYSWDGEAQDWTFCEDPAEDPTGLLLAVWEEPQTEEEAHADGYENPDYVLGADVAEGLEHGDLSTFSVINANTGEEAAAFRARPDSDDYVSILEATGRRYRNALLGVENNGVGSHLPDNLRRRGYPRLYRMETIGSVKRRKINKWGWNSNKRTKAKMISDFRKALKTGDVQIRDRWFVTEAKTFVANGKGSYAATPGKTDDTVMAKMITWQMAMEAPKYEYVPEEEPAPEGSFADKYGTPEELMRFLEDYKRRAGTPLNHIPTRESRRAGRF